MANTSPLLQDDTLASSRMDNHEQRMRIPVHVMLSRCLQGGADAADDKKGTKNPAKASQK